MSRSEVDATPPDSPHTNLPTVWTSFVGRGQELDEVTQLLSSSRLITLSGAAGCGKSRLALRAARAVSDHYADGAHWIEFARLAEPALVPQTTAKALRIPEQANRPALERLCDALQDRDLLLVLDNCEHLLEACAQFVERLLSATDVSILATSREPLSVRGEKLYPVDPLSLPPSSFPPDDVGGIAQFDAIRLFVERARATVPAFELTADNASVIADICRQLDGIPLAIELASARLNVLTSEQIAARLDDQFALLPEATHITYSHHDTLRAAIAWSYDMLSTPEQVVLRRLSVFAGGCTLKTAETVSAGNGVEREQMLELLSSLVNKSLVVAKTLQRGKARYSLLESIRQYAQEKLIASGEEPAIRDRHLQYFVEVAEETEPKLKGEFQQLWLNWLEGDYDNIRAALTWSLESDQIEDGLRIAIAIYQFWTVRGYMEEGAAWLKRLLAQVNEDISALVHANALAYAAFLAEFRGDSAAQMVYGKKAAALAEALGDEETPALAWTLKAQAFGARAADDEETGFALYKQIVQLYRELGDRYNLGETLTTCGIAAMSLGNYDDARAMLEEALPLVREAGEPYSIAMLLNFSGDLARCEQTYARAKHAYEESIFLLRDLDAECQLASVLHNLGHTCLHLDNVDRARDLFDESMALQQAQHNTPGIGECLIGFAGLAISEELPAAGARLLAAAVALGGERVTTAWEATRLEYEEYLQRARAGLTEETFQAEQAAGRTLSLEQAVAYAQEVGDEAAQKATAARRAREKLDELTPREKEVAALIAQARSNAGIAKELVVSKRTVEKHISNIRSKLGFTKRAQIVRWAIESGVVDQPG